MQASVMWWFKICHTSTYCPFDLCVCPLGCGYLCQTLIHIPSQACLNMDIWLAGWAWRSQRGIVDHVYMLLAKALLYWLLRLLKVPVGPKTLRFISGPNVVLLFLMSKLQWGYSNVWEVGIAIGFIYLIYQLCMWHELLSTWGRTFGPCCEAKCSNWSRM